MTLGEIGMLLVVLAVLLGLASHELRCSAEKREERVNRRLQAGPLWFIDELPNRQEGERYER